ncbi:hypothetical protein F511_19985 [Dorcoceras hygrometricum]|uniref:Integrase catalytic domain-containing protein n=1 Tax=Dorcoceras hygrometricum TaxID=472368 RepID=A0A2Z7BMP8_9LAMI|nr:hypothetical protein F511_19985 [Dorcoceras hygrometricum]
MKQKNEALQRFSEKVLIESQIGERIKRLRTDIGLEYVNKEFTELCRKSGIATHIIVRHPTT